jgi:hypothetical protein
MWENDNSKDIICTKTTLYDLAFQLYYLKYYFINKYLFTS